MFRAAAYLYASSVSSLALEGCIPLRSPSFFFVVFLFFLILTVCFAAAC